MNVRFASKKEIGQWDEHLLANPDGGNIFASYEFAMQKKLGHYRPSFIFVDDIAITVLEKRPLPGLKLWYLPKGPGVTTTKEVFEILESLKPFAKKHGAFALRIEPELDISIQSTLSRHGLIKASPIIPNPSTIAMDIKPSLDKIMENLPQKGRHAIRRAERDGVEIKQVKATDENCKSMYELLLETAQDRFGIRDYHYFHTFWQNFEKVDMGQLFFAYFDGKIVAGAFATVLGKKSTYKDGASSRKRSAYGASHLLQWHVISWAKSKGATRHDLCGSPPSDKVGDPNHRHYGIGLFKTAFNKKVTDYVGCYDFIVRPFIYRLWSSVGERIVKRLYYYRHHDIYY